MKTKRKLLQPRWRKVLADLWEGRTRTLLVVASIAVGVFAIGTIATTYFILNTDLNFSYAAIHPANIEMVTTPFDEDFLSSVARIPGVAFAEGRQTMNVRAGKDGVTWVSLDLLAVKDPGLIQVNQVRPVVGKAVPGKHELVIGYDKMRDTGFRTGDWIQVKLADDTIRWMRVVGEVSDQTATQDPLSDKRGYISNDTLDWLGGSWNYNRLWVTVRQRGDDEDYIQQVANAVEDQVEKNGGAVSHTSIFRSDEFPMVDMAMAVFGILGVLAVLVVLLSSSLIVNTLNALFAQQLRQIGVMKLVGARRGQVLGMYLLMILAYSLLALLIAVPLSAWAGYELARMMAGMFSAVTQGFRVIPAALVIDVIVAIGVPLAAGILPVRRGSRISVRRAISNTSIGDQAPRHGLPAGLDRLGVGLLSRPVLLSIRNTFRRTGRLVLTLFTLTMAGAIFIAVFNVRASMDAYMDRLLQHFMADITLTFDHPYRAARVIQEVGQIPGVERVEAWSGAPAEILDSRDNVLDNLNLVAPPADTPLLKAEMLAGRWLQPGDQRALVVSEGIYTLYPGLQPGDTLRLRLAGDRTETWTIVGVFSFTQMLGGVMGYADYDYVSGLLGTHGQSASYRLVTSTHTAESQQVMSEAIDRQLRSLNYAVKEIKPGAEIRQQAGQMVNILIVFLLIMALLTAFVGSIGLTGTMGMNVLERTREIGVMRAIGAVDLAIVKSVVIEGVLVGLISWACAWVVSYPISIVMLRIVSTAMQTNTSIGLTYTLGGVLVWLGVVVVLSAVASVLPARSAARLTIREVLAYE